MKTRPGFFAVMWTASAALSIVACGSTAPSTTTTDGGTEAASSDAALTDVSVTPVDGGPDFDGNVPQACLEILTYLEGCSPNDAELKQAAREYATVGPAAVAAIDAYAACAAAAEADASCSVTHPWTHGVCQTQAGNATAAVSADPALASLKCVLSADYVPSPTVCHRSDQTTFTCAGGAADYGKCCVAAGTEVACFFSDYTFLNIHSY